jgi:hypothetical protein
MVADDEEADFSPKSHDVRLRRLQPVRNIRAKPIIAALKAPINEKSAAGFPD